MGQTSTHWRALGLACLVIAAVAAGCGGDSGAPESGATLVEVEASNTSAGRFPDEELVRSQQEAAEAAAAAAEAAAAEVETSEQADAEALPPPPAEPAVALEEETMGIPAGVLAAGRYTSATFEPAFSLELPEGWLTFQPELVDFVAISPADDLDLSISFVSPNLALALVDEEAEYTDQDPTGDQLLDPTAFDYFDWIHAHPSYQAGEIRSELLAGRAVSSFDATLALGYAWNGCLARCALLVATSDGELLAQEVGYRERLYATTVEDLSFIVSVAAPEEKFEAFVARATELLLTLQLAADAVDEQLEEPPAPPVATVDEPDATDDPASVEPARLPPAPLAS